MTVDLDSTDIMFIYGTLKKKLAELDVIASRPDCPFDKQSIDQQKKLYLSVTDKLGQQVPNLLKMDNYL